MQARCGAAVAKPLISLTTLGIGTIICSLGVRIADAPPDAPAGAMHSWHCFNHGPRINTMNRCVFALLAALAIALPAQAQRLFENNALRGELVVTAPPEALLNGKPVRLSPGVRIRNQQNLIQTSGTLIEQKLIVHYTLDGVGQLREVWLLTDEEARRLPWPRTPEESQRWQFDPTLQRWTKP
jgi:hypothetical protein